MNSFEAIRIKFILEKQAWQTGMTQARDTMMRTTSDMQSSLNNLKASHVSAFRSMQNEIPGFSSVLSLLKNPYVAAAAGVAVFYKSMSVAAKKAADFNSQFRELQNLNLDKSVDQLNQLKDAVLQTSFTYGFDKMKTSAAFFDVQSVTGKFGDEVQQIVAKQGEFARIMRADFNNWIAGTGVAMANYGFSARELDEFNQSAYASMNLGKITFDELSKVMAVYAGAAASAQQSYDTANKILTLFTIKTKSADEAATLTKSLFNDLTKKTTLDALKKAGINPFDNGKIKQADTLLLELNKKFATLKNDKAILTLKNQFAGSEGLIAYIQSATDKSGNLRQMMENFQNMKLNMKVAVDYAEEDLNEKFTELKNKWDVLVTDLGEAFQPLLLKLTNLGIGALDYLDWNVLNGPEGRYNRYLERGRSAVNEEYPDIKKQLQGMTFDQAAELRNNLFLRVGDMKKYMSDMQERFGNLTPGSGDWMDVKLGLRSREEVLADRTGYMYPLLHGKQKAYNELATTLMDLWQEAQKEKENNKNGNGEGSGGGSGTGLGSSIDQVTDSAKQVRNITVNIDAFNKGGINTETTNLQHMDANEIENWFNEMLLRVVRNLELSN